MPSKRSQETVESKWARLKGTHSDGPKVNWSWAPVQMLQDVIVSVTEDGAAILFSKTSDGGALSLTVLDGSHRVKWYPADEPELRDILEMLSGNRIG